MATPRPIASRPVVLLEVHDLQAAATIVDALRGRQPKTRQEARKRAALAEQLGRALMSAFLYAPAKELR